MNVLQKAGYLARPIFLSSRSTRRRSSATSLLMAWVMIEKDRFISAKSCPYELKGVGYGPKSALHIPAEITNLTAEVTDIAMDNPEFALGYYRKSIERHLLCHMCSL